MNQGMHYKLANKSHVVAAERYQWLLGSPSAPEASPTARFLSGTPSPTASSAFSRPPCLTIPPGLSPAALLDSPVLLPNSHTLKSPTTGCFQLPPLEQEILEPDPSSADAVKEIFADMESFFMFNSQNDSPKKQVCTLPLAEHLDSADTYNETKNIRQMQVDFDDQVGVLGDINGFTNVEKTDMKDSNKKTADTKHVGSLRCLCRPLDQIDTDSEQLYNQYQTELCPTAGRQAEDGYNWRKYGQKHVKGSDYPRSYYKCTHPSCQVKEKVERAHDGRITEIIYRGSHNHRKPQPARQSAYGFLCSPDDTMGSGSEMNINESIGGEQSDGLERTSSMPVVTELSETPKPAQGKKRKVLEPVDNQELPSNLSGENDDDDDDGATNGSMSVEDDGGDDETESKKRKEGTSLVETSSSSHAFREPRIVVQTDSEIDILDDGYRWRKYGQKVVKGNPNPRSYYKCTNPGCAVRKHVERASHNLKSVITTYEGKHNHVVPTARNSNQAGSCNNTHLASNSQSAAEPGSTNFSKPGLQMFPHVDKRQEFGSDFFKPSYRESIPNLGPTSCYDFKIPLPPPMSLGSLGLNNSFMKPYQARFFPNIIQESQVPFPSGHQGPDYSLDMYDLSQRRSSISGFQSLLGQKQLKDGGIRFKLPKQEPNTSLPSEAQELIYGQHG